MMLRKAEEKAGLVHVAVAADFFAGVSGTMEIGDDGFEITDKQG